MSSVDEDISMILCQFRVYQDAIYTKDLAELEEKEQRLVDDLKEIQKEKEQLQKTREDEYRLLQYLTVRDFDAEYPSYARERLSALEIAMMDDDKLDGYTYKLNVVKNLSAYHSSATSYVLNDNFDRLVAERKRRKKDT